MTSVKCNNVRVTIGSVTLLHDETMRAKSGEFVAIVGPNGAGKSTLLSVLAGDRTPDSGTVHLNGLLVRELTIRKLARLRAVLPQQTKTLFSFTAKDVVTMGRYDCNDGRNDESVVAEVMELTGTSALINRAYPTLSGGEQSLVNLARVLAQQTAIIFLDEPTAALDIANQEHVCEVARTAANEGRTIIAVLHDLNLAARYADRIVVISAGRIVANSTPALALTAELLTSVYQTHLAVIDHPFHPNIPLVLANTGGQYVR